MYYKPILSINEKYNNPIKIDTIEGKVRAIETSIKVGTVDIKATSLAFVGMGKKSDWYDSTAVNIIGTVGNDFMENNPIILDFKDDKIKLID